MKAAPVPTAELRRLERIGLNHGAIARKVGMTRQGVSYRLKTADAAERARLISAPPKARWYPRKPVKRPEMCGTCERPVDCGRLGPESLVREPTYCRWCSRPMTEAAKNAAPNFVSIVRAIDRAPAQVRKTVMSDIEE